MPSIVESTRLVHESVGEGGNRHIIERCDEPKTMKKKKNRSKAQKKKARLQREACVEDSNGLILCLFCKCSVPNVKVAINNHNAGKNHRRLEELHLYIPFFEEHGLFPTIGKKTYDCRVCGTCGIPASVRKLRVHVCEVHLCEGPNILSCI